MTTATLPSTHVPPTIDEEALPSRLEGVRSRALVFGGGALGAGLLWGLFSPATFFPAYLTAYVFFLGLALGSLGLLLIHHLTGGNWGFLIRRPLEAATMTLPLLVLLFLPIVLGMTSLYPWTHLHDASATGPLLEYLTRHKELLEHKSGWLNVSFWLIRALMYFAVWVGIAFLIRSRSVAQDDTRDPSPTRRNQSISAPAMIALFLSVTFAMVDWMMSIEPEWYSTIYGVMVFTGMGLSALALMIVVSSRLAHVRPLAELASPARFNDLGNLLLAFTMLWAYMAFSQYLIIWSGNLAEEIPWYLKRSVGGWRFIAFALMAFHFFAPFFCLLVRENKRTAERLWRIAAVILVMQVVNDVWLVIPAYPGYMSMKLLALIPAFVGLGGLWAWEFSRQLISRTLVPRHDPMLAESLSHHGGGH